MTTKSLAVYRAPSALCVQIGAAIQTLREQRRLSRAALSTRARVSGWSLFAVEIGEAVILLDQLDRISAALGVEPFDIVRMAERAVRAHAK